VIIRAATSDDRDGIWAAIEPAIRSGEVFVIERDISREDALAWWWGAGYDVFVAVDDAVDGASDAASTVDGASDAASAVGGGANDAGGAIGAGGVILGASHVRRNQRGGGSHVANAGYATNPSAAGKGVARALCAHSLEHARTRGFTAMQFNFVVSTNENAVHLWQSMGFAIVGRLPGAFVSPTKGHVDVFVMYRAL
jgi:GNAT superfamily N-acetyltransferase